MQVLIGTPNLHGSDLEALAGEWRALEGRAAGSFFQSWTWIGCDVAERFDAPRLVRAVEGDETVGLALFNRRALPACRRALWLHQTGDARQDGVFVEHNGALVARGHEWVEGEMLGVALRDGGTLVLGGVGMATRAAVRSLGVAHRETIRAAPYARLDGRSASAWRAGLGASTRAQLGRSGRRLASLGTLSWRLAQTVDEATAFLEGLAALHQQSWMARGKAGAFAEPLFRRFHAALLERAVPRGEAMLWRLAVDDRPIAYLYNFLWKGHVLSYQSGFDMTVSSKVSPGLTAHALAIEQATTIDCERYDFLAGDVRYKRELSDAALELFWLEITQAFSLRDWRCRSASILGKLKTSAKVYTRR